MNHTRRLHIEFFNAPGNEEALLPPWRPKHVFILTPPVNTYDFMERDSAELRRPSLRPDGFKRALVFSTRQQLVYGVAVYDLDASDVEAAFRTAGFPFRHLMS